MCFPAQNMVLSSSLTGLIYVHLECSLAELKKTSIFVDIVQTGGWEVNPISKKKLQNYFLTKRGEGGGHK